MDFFAIFPYCKTNISYPVSGHGFFNSQIKGFFGNAQQIQYCLINVSYGESISTVTVKSVHIYAAINGHDIAVAKFAFVGETVYYGIIHRNAGSKWVTVVI